MQGDEAMKHFGRPVILSVVPILLLLDSPGGNHFYIDPGTGSLVIQAVIGAFAAVLVAIGMFWKQIKAFFGNLFHKGCGGTEDEESGD